MASAFVGVGAEGLLLTAGVIGDGSMRMTNAQIGFSIAAVLAGLAVMVGWQVPILSVILAGFFGVEAFASHSFWCFPAAEQHHEFVHFLKNLCGVGGLLLLSSVAVVKTTKSWARH